MRTLRRANADLLIAVVLVVLGIAMALGGLGYRLLVEGGRIGPGFMPFAAGLLLAIFAGWAGVETLRGIRSPAQPTDPAADEPVPAQTPPAKAPPGEPGLTALPDGPPTPPHDLRTRTSGNPERRVATVFILTAAAIAVSAVVGFLVAVGLLMLVLMWRVERERLWLAALLSVAAVIVAWLLFGRLLGVPLPGGMLNLLGTG